MKKSFMKKAIVVALCLAITVTMLVGCTGKDKNKTYDVSGKVEAKFSQELIDAGAEYMMGENFLDYLTESMPISVGGKLFTVADENKSFALYNLKGENKISVNFDQEIQDNLADTYGMSVKATEVTVKEAKNDVTIVVEVALQKSESTKNVVFEINKNDLPEGLTSANLNIKIDGKDGVKEMRPSSVKYYFEDVKVTKEKGNISMNYTVDDKYAVFFSEEGDGSSQSQWSSFRAAVVLKTEKGSVMSGSTGLEGVEVNIMHGIGFDSKITTVTTGADGKFDVDNTKGQVTSVSATKDGYYISGDGINLTAVAGGKTVTGKISASGEKVKMAVLQVGDNMVLVKEDGAFKISVPKLEGTNTIGMWFITSNGKFVLKSGDAVAKIGKDTTAMDNLTYNARKITVTEKDADGGKADVYYGINSYDNDGNKVASYGPEQLIDANLGVKHYIEINDSNYRPIKKEITAGVNSYDIPLERAITLRFNGNGISFRNMTDGQSVDGIVYEIWNGETKLFSSADAEHSDMIVLEKTLFVTVKIKTKNTGYTMANEYKVFLDKDIISYNTPIIYLNPIVTA